MMVMMVGAVMGVSELPGEHTAESCGEFLGMAPGGCSPSLCSLMAEEKRAQD